MLSHCYVRIILVVLLLAPAASAAQDPPPASPKVSSAKRTLKFVHPGGVTNEAKDKEKDVLIVVEIGGITLDDYFQQTKKKAPAYNCEGRDYSPSWSVTGGRAKIINLSVFAAAKDARKCKLTFGDHSLDFLADEQVKESVSALDYLK